MPGGGRSWALYAGTPDHAGHGWQLRRKAALVISINVPGGNRIGGWLEKIDRDGSRSILGKGGDARPPVPISGRHQIGQGISGSAVRRVQQIGSKGNVLV
jgi:hypothetical protein